MQIEQGTLLILSATGDLGREASKFYLRISEMVAEIKKVEYPSTIS